MATAEQIKSFINTLGALAVAESNRRIANGQGFVLPSVCIAQSALETGWGTSGLMTRANAYFGIKAGGSWTGAVYTADTWEVANGEAYNTTANFRAYSSLADSVKDYYDLIGNNSRYAGALSFGLSQSEWKTPKQCITAIWSGGYATDTLYVEKIMSTINARNLAEWDTKIDGVSVGESTGGILAETYFFNNDMFVEGKLVVTDSGRSIQNDRSVSDWSAIDWDKAITPKYTGTAYLKGYWTNDYGEHDLSTMTNPRKIYVARLLNDTATVSETPISPNDPIQVIAGEKIGIFMPYPLENVQSSKYRFTIEPTQYTIDNSARYDEPIAFFVKVE